MNLRNCALLIATLALLQQSEAVVLFGGDNSANLADPGSGVPFDTVALLSYDDGSVPTGSAVHLGNGYMLTADHVGIEALTQVTFDGVTYLERDLTFTPTQVADNVDLKIFRLASTPTVGTVNLYAGSAELGTQATIVGCGRGRDPSVPINSLSVAWGNASTMAKRWGLNVPQGFDSLDYEDGTYDALVTVLGSPDGTPAGLGADEAGVTLIDSGSGLFQQHGGSWYLVGLTTSVETFGTSNFGDDSVAGSGDSNYFVRISSYESDIAALIPEPSSAMLLTLGLAFIRRRRL